MPHEVAKPVAGEDAEGRIGQRLHLGAILGALHQIAGQVEIQQLPPPILRRRPAEGPAGIEGEDAIANPLSRAHQTHAGPDASNLPHPGLWDHPEQGEGAHGTGGASPWQGC